MPKILFAGPFVGEFGVELFMWQGHIRNMSDDFDKTIISSRYPHYFLYQDFCNDFIPYDAKSVNCDGFECIDQTEIPNIHEHFNPTKVVRTVGLQSYLNDVNGTKQKFVSYYQNNSNEPNIDVCICARFFNKGATTKVQRNWKFDECVKVVNCLLDSGLRVASVGLSCSANYIPNTINYMDIKLRTLAKVLSNSKMIVGPSSGVMHFATLCKCPQVVWGEANLEQRYKDEWNPFDISVQYIPEETYNVSGDIILNKISEVL